MAWTTDETQFDYRHVLSVLRSVHTGLGSHPASYATSNRSCLPGGKVAANYRGADKSLARPTSRCILFDGENISFDANLVIYINILIFLQL